MKVFFNILFTLLLVNCLNGCLLPLLFVGAATGVTTSIGQERGLGGVISDTEIKAKIKINLINAQSDTQAVDVIVHHGRVLLTGNVDSTESQLEVVRLVWKVPGIREVIDELFINQPEDLQDIAQDTAITTKLKTTLIMDERIQSLNYKVRTFKGIVYLIGIAQNKKELDRVVKYARHLAGVEKVISHVEIKAQHYQPTSSSAASQGSNPSSSKVTQIPQTPKFSSPSVPFSPSQKEIQETEIIHEPLSSEAGPSEARKNSDQTKEEEILTGPNTHSSFQ